MPEECHCLSKLMHLFTQRMMKVRWGGVNGVAEPSLARVLEIPRGPRVPKGPGMGEAPTQGN